MLMQQTNRNLWLMLFNEGGRYTAAELADRLSVHTDYMVEQLNSLHRARLIEKFQPEVGQRRLRYGITGSCSIPRGMTLAEVQL